MVFVSYKVQTLHKFSVQRCKRSEKKVLREIATKKHKSIQQFLPTKSIDRLEFLAKWGFINNKNNIKDGKL